MNHLKFKLNGTVLHIKYGIYIYIKTGISSSLEKIYNLIQRQHYFCQYLAFSGHTGSGTWNLKDSIQGSFKVFGDLRAFFKVGLNTI